MWGAIRNCSRLFGNTLETIPHYLESNRRFLNCLGTMLEPFWTIRIICGLFTGYSNDFGTIWDHSALFFVFWDDVGLFDDMW